MTKCDTEPANKKPDANTTDGLLELLTQKPLQKKDTSQRSHNSKLMISMLKDVTKHFSPHYVFAKDKGIKEGYVQSQANKKLSKASRNMSRDGWAKLAHKVSNMTDEELRAWIKN